MKINLNTKNKLKKIRKLKKPTQNKASKSSPVNFKINTIKFLKTFNFKNSIFGRLFLSFVLIILSSLLFIGITTSQNVKNNAKKTYVTSAYSVLSQNINYVDLIMENVNNYSMQLFLDDNFKDGINLDGLTTYQAFQATSSTEDIFYNIIASDNLISSIYFFDPDGMVVGSPSIKLDDKESIKNMDFYKKAIELNGANYWRASHSDEFSTASFSSNFFISDVRLIKNISTGEGLGALQINVDTSTLNSALGKNNLGKGSYTFITDNEGNVVCSPDVSLLGTNASEKEEVSKTLLDEQGEFSFTDPVTKKKMYAVYLTSETTGWKYVSIVPYENLTKSADGIKHLIIIISLICLFITMIVSTLISASIAKPLIKVVDAMEKVKNGDLSISVDNKSKDELGKLSNTFNDMVAKLRNLVSNVKESVNETSLASETIKDNTTQLTISTEEISNIIDEISVGAGDQAEQASKCAEITEIFGKEIVRVVDYSKEVDSASKEAISIADSGMNSVNLLKSKSEESAVVIDEVTNSISELSKNTKEIESILLSISKIAQQTNLLSLNASIEAARAGEAGRGFAVVAEEVRKLADESKKAADTINIIIKKVNSRTTESVRTAGLISDTLKSQVNYVDSTLDSFNNIKNSIDTVGLKINNLSESIDKIDEGKGQIIDFISDIASVSEQTAASTEEVSASATQQSTSTHDMSLLAEGLSDVAKNLNDLT
ncbi:MAG: methyl-accepting chemotaxis protein, partial [Clostridiaceae bacterium]